VSGAGRRRRVSDGVRAARWATLGVAVLFGLLLHLWYLTHRYTDSDQAVIGLMAHQMLHGHFSAFVWGQHYGGTAEEALLVPAVAVVGLSRMAINGTEIVLSACAALLTWRMARRLVSDRWLAAMAGVAAWVAPQSSVGQTTFAYGFRGVALLCGLGTVLVALRVLDGRPRRRDLFALGLVAGVGWWSSPEIVYFLLPVGIMVALATARRVHRTGPRGTVSAASAVAGGALLGALPWIWANVGSHLASLRRSAFGQPPGSPGYLGRLKTFPRYVFPMQLSLRQPFTARWLGGHAVGVGLLVVLSVGIVAAGVRCARRDASCAAVAVALLALPLLMAYSPSTWFWQDGRYAVYVGPLIVVVLVAGFQGGLAPTRARHGAVSRHRALSGLGLALVPLLAVTSTWNFLAFVAPHPTAGWGFPDNPTLSSIHQLEAASIRFGYAGYWVAYRLDFLSHERLEITVAGTDTLRWTTVDRRVRASADPAWLFVAPTVAAIGQFGPADNIQGPNGTPEARFLAYLQRVGIAYQLAHTGLIDAVIPSRPIPPELASPNLH